MYTLTHEAQLDVMAIEEIQRRHQVKRRHKANAAALDRLEKFRQ